MDPKILTAVFFSLAAVATGMNSGAVQPNDVQDVNMDEMNGLQSFSSGFGILEQLLMSRPEPDTEVRISFNSSEEMNFEFRQATVHVDNMTSYSGDSSIESDEDIVFTGFRGSASFGENSTIEGRSQGFHSSDVNVSTRFPVQIEEVDSTASFTDVRRVKLNMKNVDGSIDYDGGTTSLNGTDVRVNSFSGNITVSPEENSYLLKGKVDELNAGDLTIS
jgi:hypothetical protein